MRNHSVFILTAESEIGKFLVLTLGLPLLGDNDIGNYLHFIFWKISKQIKLTTLQKSVCVFIK